MHAIDVIKNACVEALEDEKDLGLFRAVADPETVLEMADIIDRLMAFIEAQGSAEGYALLVEVKQALHRT